MFSSNLPYLSKLAQSSLSIRLKLKQLLWPVLAALLCLAIAVSGVSAQEPRKKTWTK